MNTQDSEYEMLYEALAGEPPRRGRGIPPSKSWLGKNLIPALCGMVQDAFLL